MTDAERQQIIAALKDAREHCPVDCCLPHIDTALTTMRRERVPVAWQWLDSAVYRKKLPKFAEAGAWNPLYKD